MYCKNCGAYISDHSAFCPRCGAAISGHFQSNGFQEPQIKIIHEYRPMVSRKSRLAALLLALFLGGFGIHRFYVGKVGTGLLWLFTGGLLGFGWLVDVILIACGAFRDHYGLALEKW